MIKRSLVVLIMLSGLMPQSMASGSPKWEAIDVSDLSNVEQFEKRKFTFTVRISDQKVLSKLKEPGFYIGGGAVLTPKDQGNFYGNSKISSVTYPCFSVEPPSFGGENAYSALRGSEARFSTYSDFKYSCWFPAGMRQGRYTLTIYQNLWSNNGWSSSDSWANFQMFVFGEAESSLSKFYTENFKGLIADGRAVIHGNLPISDISVYRKNDFGQLSELVLNPTGIQSKVENLELEYKKYQEYLEKLNGKIIHLQQISTANANLLGKIQVKLLSRSQKNELQTIKAEIDRIKEKTKKVQYNSVPQFNNSELDPYQSFLRSINFDLGDRPVIFFAEYPNVSKIGTASTPFLKFMVRSKTQIYRISAHISPLKEGRTLGFVGNLVFPGQEPVNNQVGGGLALIERQEILDGYLYSTILVSPMYTPITKEELESARISTHTSATVTDVAGNSSIEWNRLDGVDGLIPNSIRPDFLEGSFDELKSDYQELYLARQKFLKIPDYLSQKEEISSAIASLEKASLNLKSRILTIGKAARKSS